MGHVTGVAVERVEDLEGFMLEVARRCGFNVRTVASEQFYPVGATTVLVLAESHFSCHTYPEEGTVYMDVFCCSPTFNPLQCAKTIETVFSAKKGNWRVVRR